MNLFEPNGATRFGGCDCSYGKDRCDCIVPQACERPEHPSPKSWALSDLAIVLIAAGVVAMWALGVFQ